MSHVSSFKKFLKEEDKKTTEVGANPTIKEQAPDAAPVETPAATPAPTPSTDVTNAPTQAQIDAVSMARTALAQAEANRDKVISVKQSELDKLKTDQDTIVNTAKKNLSDKLTAAKQITV